MTATIWFTILAILILFFCTRILQIKAEDGGGLSSAAMISIRVEDVQDKAPILLNAPYSTTVQEGTPPVRNMILLF